VAHLAPRRALAAALALGASFALAGCNASTSDPAAPEPSLSASPVEPADPGDEAAEPDLSTFYSQGLDWEPCGANQCADLQVPLDYAEPDGETITLEVLRVPAGDQGQRLGSLVVNPGGYVGESTSREIAYARTTGTPVSFTHPV